MCIAAAAYGGVKARGREGGVIHAICGPLCVTVFQPAGM